MVGHPIGVQHPGKDVLAVQLLNKAPHILGGACSKMLLLRKESGSFNSSTFPQGSGLGWACLSRTLLLACAGDMLSSRPA